MLLPLPLGECVAESYTDEAFRLRAGASYELTALTEGASVLDATVLHFGQRDLVNVTLSVGFAQVGRVVEVG